MPRSFLVSLFRPGLGLVAGLLAFTTLHAERIEIVWPTPNPAFLEGQELEDILQPTASGEALSGGFGCVRSAGHKFHEGVDLKPIARDRHGEPTDEIMAAMDGVIRHINPRAGDSSYGRYLVLEHPSATPAVYTLYAHLARIAPGLKEGDPVRRGQPIATMGHTAGGYAIPRERAHLHFEIGLWVTRDFQSWYSRCGFGSPNSHGVWNGMNLLGIDALDFMTQWRDRHVDDFQSYFARMQPAVRLRVATPLKPDFLQRYPALQNGEASGLIAGWDIECHWTGLPFRWTPLTALQVAGMSPNEVRIVAVDEEQLRQQRCKQLVRTRRGNREPGPDLKGILQQLFGFTKR